MKNHNCTCKPAPAGCQPDSVRYLVEKFRKSVARLLLWFIAAELESKAKQATKKTKPRSASKAAVPPVSVPRAVRAGSGRRPLVRLGE